MRLQCALEAARRYDSSAIRLEEARRAMQNRGLETAARIARENRDTARRLHLEAIADALEAGWVVS